MAKPESWQISTDSAEVYESCLVPAIFGAWANPVADTVGIEAGNRVLDVACGTGVLAREALKRVEQNGQIVGLDLNARMLAVAARTEANHGPGDAAVHEPAVLTPVSAEEDRNIWSKRSRTRFSGAKRFW